MGRKMLVKISLSVAKFNRPNFLGPLGMDFVLVVFVGTIYNVNFSSAFVISADTR